MMPPPAYATSLLFSHLAQILVIFEGDDYPIEHLAREEFYARVKAEQTLLVIACGEPRRFANLLLTVSPVLVKAPGSTLA